MSRILLVLTLLVTTASIGFAQTRTVETRTEVDSATGERRTVSAETVSTSEDITPRSNMIVINPLKFILYYNLNYYHRLSNSMVIGGGLQMPTISGLDGFGANAEIRLHPSAKAMRGFYIAPNVSFNSLETEYTTWDEDLNTVKETASTSAISIGALLGWQWFPGDDFAIGLGIGLDYYFLTSNFEDNEGNDPFSSFNGTAPALRFDIGYAW